MRRLGPACVAILLVGVCACDDEGLYSAPREHLDEATSAVTSNTTGHTTSTHGSGNGSGSTGTTSTTSTTGSGSTSSTTTTSTTTTTGTSTTGSNCTQSAAAPTLSCSRSDGLTTWLALGSDVHLGCTLTSATESPSSWSGQDALGLFNVDVRSAPDVVSVGLSDAQVPNNFSDAQLQVTITANFCDEAPAQTVVTLPVLGNSIVADHYQGIVKVFSSAGTDKGLFAATAFTGRPNMIANLHNGDVLIGGWNDTLATGFIVEVDRNGQLVHTFDATDSSSNTLYPGCSSGSGCEVAPFDAAEGPDGKIWVTINSGVDSTGYLRRFLPSGAYYDTVAEPPSAPISTWLPMGVVQGPGGEMIVATGYGHSPPYLAVYPSGSTAGNFVPIDMKTCDQSGTCTEQSFNEMGLAGLYWDGQDTLYIANSWDDDEDSDLGAFDASTFAFLRGTRHPAGISDLTYNLVGFRSLTGDGDWLLASAWNECGWAVDRQNLYPVPQQTGVSSQGCAVGDQSDIYDPRGIAHFSAP